MKSILQIQVNRQSREDAVPDNALLIDYLRDVLGLTGTKQGCDGGECGACTVLVDGVPRLACSTLAHSVAGRHIETIEGLATKGNLSRLQQAFEGPDRHHQRPQGDELWPARVSGLGGGGERLAGEAGPGAAGGADCTRYRHVLLALRQRLGEARALVR